MAQSARDAAAAQAASGRLAENEVPMTYGEHVARLAGGMEAAMHLILCLRQVYPSGAYASQTRRARCGPVDAALGHTGTATYTSFYPTFPALQTYFARIRAALQAQLTHQDVAAVALLLHLPRTGKVLERYVFRLAYAWPAAPPPHERTVPVESAWSAADFDFKFAGMMGRLTALLATLSPLPHVGSDERGAGHEGSYDEDEVSCAVVLQLHDPSDRPSAHGAGARPDPHQPREGAWVPLDAALTRSLPQPRQPGPRAGPENAPGDPLGPSPGPGAGSGAGSGPARARQTEIVTVQSLASGVIDMTVYVEDHKVAKTHARRHAGGQRGGP